MMKKKKRAGVVDKFDRGGEEQRRLDKKKVPEKKKVGIRGRGRGDGGQEGGIIKEERWFFKNFI